MTALGTANVVNLASTGATPGALALGSDVPAGSQLAIILIRFDGNTGNVSIVSLSSSFGDVTILGQTAGLDSNCALAYVVVSSTGSGKTITPVFNSGTFFDRRIFGIVFIDGVDVSSQSAWLRDWAVQYSNGVATATVDTQPGDFVFSGLGNYAQTPGTPAGTTSLIAPNASFDIRHRVVQLDTPDGDGASFSSGDSYGSASAISIIPGASAIEIDADIEQISLSTFSADIDLDVNIASAIESLLLTTQPAVVSLDSTVDASSEQIVVTTLPASVVADTGIAAGAEQIALATFGAQVELAVAINANAEQISLGTFLAVIASDRSIAGITESIELTTYPAGISVGSSIAAQTEQIVLETLPAQIVADVAINAHLQSIILSTLSAQIGLAAHVATNVESLTLTTYGATITLSGGIQAQLEQLTLRTFMASIQTPLPEFVPGGLEYTIRGDRAHYTLPVNRIHITFKG